MNTRATILCPVDFSDASRGALRYARVLAEHFGGRMIVLSVEDPLLTEAIDLGTGHVWDPDDTRTELVRFVRNVLGSAQARTSAIDYEVAVGRPAEQILTTAREKRCDLIVMSTHGLTGVRKMFFGSTTERVLRETTIPILATPSADEGPKSSAELQRTIGRVLVPVDLSAASLHQVQIARGICEALSVPMLVTCVVEPVRSPLAAKLHLPGIELERRTRAEDALAAVLATVPRQRHPEALVAYGDPAEEISKIAHDRRAGLLVIGLHGSPMLGPRMGSVTYRVLCLTQSLVLALPPRPTTAAREPGGEVRSYVRR